MWTQDEHSHYFERRFRAFGGKKNISEQLRFHRKHWARIFSHIFDFFATSMIKFLLFSQIDAQILSLASFLFLQTVVTLS